MESKGYCIKEGKPKNLRISRKNEAAKSRKFRDSYAARQESKCLDFRERSDFIQTKQTVNSRCDHIISSCYFQR